MERGQRRVVLFTTTLEMLEQQSPWDKWSFLFSVYNQIFPFMYLEGSQKEYSSKGNKTFQKGEKIEMKQKIMPII